jgi:hypothetical protein
MTQDDTEDFARLMAVLCDVFDKEMTDRLLEVYFQTLEPVPIDQVKYAGKYLLLHGKWFPKPADFLDCIMGDAHEQGQLAWCLMIDIVARLGGYASLIVEDPGFSYALENTFGNWQRACAMLPEPSDPMFANLRKQFLANFQRAIKNNETGTRYYVGQVEQTNREMVSTWLRGDFPMLDGEPVFYSKVGVISQGKLSTRRLPFSALTGALTNEAHNRLMSTGKLLQLHASAAD